MTLSITSLSIECRYTMCCYAVCRKFVLLYCHYAQCCYAECRGTRRIFLKSKPTHLFIRDYCKNTLAYTLDGVLAGDDIFFKNVLVLQNRRKSKKKKLFDKKISMPRQ